MIHRTRHQYTTHFNHSRLWLDLLFSYSAKRSIISQQLECANPWFNSSWKPVIPFLWNSPWLWIYKSQLNFKNDIPYVHYGGKYSTSFSRAAKMLIVEEWVWIRLLKMASSSSWMLSSQLNQNLNLVNANNFSESGNLQVTTWDMHIFHQFYHRCKYTATSSQ